MSITDFKEWTFALDLENYEEIDSLFQSVKQVSDYGMYRTVEGKKPGTYIVTAWTIVFSWLPKRHAVLICAILKKLTALVSLKKFGML